MALLGLAALAGCGARHSAAALPGRVQVVAGENFWGSVAAQIGGDHVQVTSLVTDPDADPHLYESDARDAGEVAGAALVIENGVGYDDFLTKLVAASSRRGRVVLSVQQVLGVTGQNANPHLWYDIPRIPQVAQAIEAALGRTDPGATPDLAANLRTFDSSLQPIDAVIAEIRSRHAGAPVAYTERVPGYLLTAAGLDNLTPSGFARAVEDGNEPSPADSEAMDRLLDGHRVRLLLYNTQTVSAVTQHVRQVATAAHIPVVGVSETMPTRYRTYQAWQLAQTRAILQALDA